jgi:sortase A
MKKLLAQLRGGMAKDGQSPQGNCMGPGAASPTRTQAAPRSRQPARFFLKTGQYLCLLLAFLCLGSVALNYLRSAYVQRYESWRLDRALGRKVPKRNSGLLAWFEHAHFALMGEAGMKVNRTEERLPSPIHVDRGAAPAVPSLPTGALVGRLEIPTLAISVMVLEGDNDKILGEAAGHVPSTALPGAVGNVVVAGHRDTFFRALRNVRNDDKITFTTTAGAYRYQVDAIRKVAPGDVQVLKASAHPTLTLITCYPFNYIGPAPLRFVVGAREIGSPEGNGADQLLARQNDGAGQLLASTLPARDFDSSVRTKSSAAPGTKTRLISNPASGGFQVTHHAAASRLSSSRAKGSAQVVDMAESQPPPAVKTHAIKDPESAQKMAESQQDDPPADSAAQPHKKFGKMRALLEYVPHHLKKELSPASAPEPN